jgi:hypothetical protein
VDYNKQHGKFAGSTSLDWEAHITHVNDKGPTIMTNLEAMKKEIAALGVRARGADVRIRERRITEQGRLARVSKNSKRRRRYGRQ